MMVKCSNVIRNQGTVRVQIEATNQPQYQHIDEQFNFIRELVQNKVLEIYYVHTLSLFLLKGSVEL